MRTQKCLIGLMLLLLASGVYADNEFWSAVTLQFPYREKVKLQVIPEIRVRNNLSDLYYLRIYLGPSIAVTKNFGLNFYFAPNYVKSSNSWTSLGYFDLTYKTDLPWQAIVFYNRERFEYDFSARVLKLRGLFRFGWQEWFADDELFYNVNQGYFDEGRSQFGYNLKINNDASVAISYLLRRQKASAAVDWARTSAVYLGVKI